MQQGNLQMQRDAAREKEALCRNEIASCATADARNLMWADADARNPIWADADAVARNLMQVSSADAAREKDSPCRNIASCTA
jgi:hypothetical protein